MADSSSKKKRTKQLGLRVNAELWAQFQGYCDANDFKTGAKVEAALREWLERQAGARGSLRHGGGGAHRGDTLVRGGQE